MYKRQVYLPYSKNTTQAQQAENRQADIISAFPAGTVDSAYLRRSELFCSLPASGKPQKICIGFASALPEAQAEEIARALDGIGAAERLGILAVSVKDGGASLYRTRWLVTLAALGVMMLGAGVALGVLVRKKRAELKANALIDPRYEMCIRDRSMQSLFRCIGASVRICQSFVLHQALAIRSLTKLPHTLRKRTPTSKVSIVAVSIV